MFKNSFKASVRWIVLCDTNGGTLPNEISNIIEEVKNYSFRKIRYSCS